ncbi:MAG: hypothetical protein MHM6MM_001266 [Cercozoa sp. M6MM]
MQGSQFEGTYPVQQPPGVAQGFENDRGGPYNIGQSVDAAQFGQPSAQPQAVQFGGQYLGQPQTQVGQYPVTQQTQFPTASQAPYPTQQAQFGAGAQPQQETYPQPQMPAQQAFPTGFQDVPVSTPPRTPQKPTTPSSKRSGTQESSTVTTSETSTVSSLRVPVGIEAPGLLDVIGEKHARAPSRRELLMAHRRAVQQGLVPPTADVGTGAYAPLQGASVVGLQRSRADMLAPLRVDTATYRVQRDPHAKIHTMQVDPTRRVIRHDFDFQEDVASSQQSLRSFDSHASVLRGVRDKRKLELETIEEGSAKTTPEARVDYMSELMKAQQKMQTKAKKEVKLDKETRKQMRLMKEIAKATRYARVLPFGYYSAVLCIWGTSTLLLLVYLLLLVFSDFGLGPLYESVFMIAMALITAHTLFSARKHPTVYSMTLLAMSSAASAMLVVAHLGICSGMLFFVALLLTTTQLLCAVAFAMWGRFALGVVESRKDVPADDIELRAQIAGGGGLYEEDEAMLHARRRRKYRPDVETRRVLDIGEGVEEQDKDLGLQLLVGEPWE